MSASAPTPRGSAPGDDSSPRELTPARLPVRGLLEFAVYGPDLDELERFYRELFGLDPIARADRRLVALRCGQATLLLFDPAITRQPGPIPHHGSEGAGHLAFVIADQERPAWRERLRQYGVAIEKEVEWEEGGASIYFRDPAGNSVELAPPTIWGGLGRGGLASLGVTGAIQQRRSIKTFTAQPVARAQLERLIAAAALAPNHHLTQPWRFYVLGPAARERYGRVLGARKARKVADQDAAAQVIDKLAREHVALPAMIVVAMNQDADPEKREEDFAATMMAVQNLALAALEEGLGTHIKSGAVMADPGARAAVGVPEEERIVAVVNVGYPAAVPSPKPRASAAELTRWTD
jgi:nitroreductase/catechol 2,3-dioxygenase-like lactoylglutathione lyase family enzyme